MEAIPTVTIEDRILRISEISRIVGLSRSQIYLLISQGKFPKQIKLTPAGKAAGWLHSEVLEYLNARISESRTQMPV
ncbi:MAG: AlpA family phage regulatory protein [Marinoscillum sp.]